MRKRHPPDVSADAKWTVFGHIVRGPLKLLKEKILSDDDSSLNLLQYVSDFKNIPSKATEVARSNHKSAQSKIKMHNDEMLRI